MRSWILVLATGIFGTIVGFVLVIVGGILLGNNCGDRFICDVGPYATMIAFGIMVLLLGTVFTVISRVLHQRDVEMHEYNDRTVAYSNDIYMQQQRPPAFPTTQPTKFVYRTGTGFPRNVVPYSYPPPMPQTEVYVSQPLETPPPSYNSIL